MAQITNTPGPQIPTQIDDSALRQPAPAKADATKGAAKAREWFDQQGLDMLVIGANSGAALALAKLAAVAILSVPQGPPRFLPATSPPLHLKSRASLLPFHPRLSRGPPLRLS